MDQTPKPFRFALSFSTGRKRDKRFTGMDRHIYERYGGKEESDCFEGEGSWRSGSYSIELGDVMDEVFVIRIFLSSLIRGVTRIKRLLPLTMPLKLMQTWTGARISFRTQQNRRPFLSRQYLPTSVSILALALSMPKKNY